MMNISELVFAARKRAGLKSLRSLSVFLGLSPGVARQWISGMTLPSDDNMVRLCTMAGFDPVPWLLRLNMQRADGPAIAIYGELLHILRPDDDDAQAA